MNLKTKQETEVVYDSVATLVVDEVLYLVGFSKNGLMFQKNFVDLFHMGEIDPVVKIQFFGRGSGENEVDEMQMVTRKFLGFRRDSRILFMLDAKRNGEERLIFGTDEYQLVEVGLSLRIESA